MSGLLRETLKSAHRNNLRAIVRFYCSKKPQENTPVVKDTPGLSKKVLEVPKNEVGPGASKKSTYKNPEYFCYHSGSYFEAEVEMLKYRLPQPSNAPAQQAQQE